MWFIGLDLNTQIYPFVRCTFGHFTNFEANRGANLGAKKKKPLTLVKGFDCLLGLV
jgi:hypothetical protein